MKKPLLISKNWRKFMRITISQLLLTLLCSSVAFAHNSSAQEVLNRPITIVGEQLELRGILSQIEKQTDIKFVYSTKIKSDQRLNLNVTKRKLSAVLDEILKPISIDYEVIESRILLRKSKSAVKISQEATREVVQPILSTDQLVNGTVTDEQGEALTGVSILIKGTAQGTTTNLEGRFSLDVVEKNAILVFSYVGYLTQEVQMANQTLLNIVLQSDAEDLNEVVVVGYGVVKKSDLTGAVGVISSKEYKAQPVTRIDQIIQGRASGVQVLNNAGAPGGDVSIRIRGANSILGDNNPLYVIDGFIGADFNNINPRDIESIEILKDASSTAIYGSRGANGVVLITTKRGNKEKANIEFTSTFSSSEVLKKFDLLNAGEFASIVNQRMSDLKLNPVFTNDQISEFNTKGGTDWQNEIFRTANGQDHQLSISGGSGKTNYLVSGNYLNEDGIIINSGFKRYSIRSNISTNFSDKFKFSLNLSGVRKEFTNTQGADGKNSVLTQALAWAPTTKIRDAAGNFIASDPVGSIAYNPVALALDRSSEYVSNSINIISRGTYTILDGLSLDALLGLDYLGAQGAFFGGRAVSNNLPYSGRYTTEGFNIQSTNTLTYRKTFNQIHSLAIMGGFESQLITSEGFAANANNLLFPNLSFNNISLAATTSNSSSYSKSGIVSLIGRVNYAFKDKYLLTMSIRRDGSSKFQEDNKYSTFPSAAIAWKISEEPFLKNSKTINLFKVRASYGATGSQAINPYGTLSTYSSDAGSSLNSGALSPNIFIGNPENPVLRWETTRAFDVGLDFGIEKGNLSISIDYFKKNTTDLLMPQPVPTYLGGGSIISNIGEVENSGLEFSLASIPVKKENFSWTSNLVFSLLKNKVISLGNQTIFYHRSNIGAGLSTQPEFVLVPGQGLGSYWGLKYLGTWKPTESETAKLFGNKPGDSRYEDVNGDSKINTSDFQIIGNGMPKTSFGWNNTFQYKSLSLNVFVQALMDFDKLNYTYGAAISVSADARQATISDIRNRYIVGSNETSEIPAFSSTSVNYLQSSRFLEQGDFVRLKNLNLSYDFPENLIKKVGVKLFVGAINLITFTKYKGIDPESSSSTSGNDLRQSIDYGSYPNSKKIYLGASIKF